MSEQKRLIIGFHNRSRRPPSVSPRWKISNSGQSTPTRTLRRCVGLTWRVSMVLPVALMAVEAIAVAEAAQMATAIQKTRLKQSKNISLISMLITKLRSGCRLHKNGQTLWRKSWSMRKTQLRKLSYPAIWLMPIKKRWPLKRIWWSWKRAPSHPMSVLFGRLGLRSSITAKQMSCILRTLNIWMSLRRHLLASMTRCRKRPMPSARKRKTW